MRLLSRCLLRFLELALCIVLGGGGVWVTVVPLGSRISETRYGRVAQMPNCGEVLKMPFAGVCNRSSAYDEHSQAPSGIPLLPG
ncbi:MAG: hypothetical protein JWM16_3117, partial [Verrucomicrobiales bacterium]|nr:hypothetical protein [Verrucomicrobiales bacterium]